MEALGINLIWFLFQLGNFTLLFVGLYYVLHKPLTTLILNRRKEVADSLAAAERIRKEVEETEKRQKAMFEKTQHETTLLLQHAKDQAKELEAKLALDAQTKAEKLLERARLEMKEEHNQMQAELKKELSRMVIKATEKVLSEQISTQEKQRDIQNLVEKL